MWGKKKDCPMKEPLCGPVTNFTVPNAIHFKLSPIKSQKIFSSIYMSGGKTEIIQIAWKKEAEYEKRKRDKDLFIVE